jgi:hypothetical protein
MDNQALMFQSLYGQLGVTDPLVQAAAAALASDSLMTGTFSNFPVKIFINHLVKAEEKIVTEGLIKKEYDHFTIGALLF